MVKLSYRIKDRIKISHVTHVRESEGKPVRVSRKWKRLQKKMEKVFLREFEKKKKGV